MKSLDRSLCGGIMTNKLPGVESCRSEVSVGSL